MKLTHMIRQGRIYKTLWLGHVHLLMEMTIQEGILYIQLLDRPLVVGQCQGKNYLNSDRFDYQNKCLEIVKAFTLTKAFDN